jgi:alkylation response protein AidB-like acyl-CoA dehydrogenase
MTSTTPGLRAAVAPARRLAAERAAQGERANRLDSAVVAALVDAGFARHFVPTRFGGAAGSFLDAGEAVASVGEGCTSAAWLASILAYSGRFASFLPEEGQDELWGPGPDQLVVSALVPGGRAQRADGGWVVSGSWTYISGAEISDWALVAGPASPDRTEPPRFFAVSREQYTIEKTWHSIGMRATMSDTLVLAEAFVPTHRSFPRAVLTEGLDDATLPVCHRAPLRAAGGLAFAVPILGGARGALDATVARVAARQAQPGGRGDDRLAHLELTRAAGEIDAGLLLIERVAAMCDQGRFDHEERARHARDAAIAANLAATAVGRLARIGGTSGFADDLPTQRFWRDINCAVTHHAVQIEAAAAAYAPVLLMKRTPRT